MRKAILAVFFSVSDFDSNVTEQQNSTLEEFFYSLGLDIEEREETDYVA